MGRKRRERFDGDGMYGKPNADRKEIKTAAKSEKTELKIRLATAKATKRKWLAAILVLGIIIYLIVSSGSGLSVLNTIKGFFPTGD